MEHRIKQLLTALFSIVIFASTSAELKPEVMKAAILPDKPGAIVLFYTGGDDLRRSAWFYTRASQADGVFERGAGSLPSFTGAWKACIGFGDAPRASKATLNDFEECIDFVLVGGDTLDAAPDIQLPNSPIHAGKPFTLHYEGMPAVNASITLTQQG